VLRIVLAAALLFSAAAAAQPESTPPLSSARAPWRVGIEVDPLPYFLRGYSVVAGVRPSGLPNWRFGLGAFGATMPAAMISAENAGFGVQVPWSIAANAVYYFSPDRGGFYAGPIAMYQQTRYTHTSAPGASVDAGRMNIGLEGGFQWLPFQQIGLYLNPWIGAGAGFDLGTPAVGANEYRAGTFTPMFGLHVGYELDL